MEGEFLWSIFWEHLSLQAISSWEKNKKQNAESGLKSNKYRGYGDGRVRVLRSFNSISVILRRWKGEHERLCAMKRRLGSGRIPPVGAKSRNCTEISSYWKITQCMKYWMHAWISFLIIIFYVPVQDFKTKEPLSKKKCSFLFLLKSWVNANTAFCIVANVICWLKQKESSLRLVVNIYAVLKILIQNPHQTYKSKRKEVDASVSI